MAYGSFREMPIWQEAMEVATTVYKLTESLPKKEDYGLTSQLRRAALSVSGNIAEGFGRNHSKDKINFYFIARGSATETQSHLHYAEKVGYISTSDQESLDTKLLALIHDINKVIVTLSRSKPHPQP